VCTLRRAHATADSSATQLRFADHSEGSVKTSSGAGSGLGAVATDQHSATLQIGETNFAIYLFLS